MSGKLVPALIAGVVTAIIFFIFQIIGDYVPFVTCCTCIVFPVIGGLLAMFIYSRNADVVDPKTGAIVGLIAGVVHALLYAVFSPIKAYFQWNMMQAQLMQASKQFGVRIEPDMLIISLIVSIVLVIILIIGLYAVGGLIGGSVFKKGSTAQNPLEPPAPPPSYGV